jgi:MYXO-CTERM domain-containing protein
VWKFVVVHHSPWASGPHGGNAKLLDGRVPELLAAHGVDLLLGGHDHIYERGAAQEKYLVSGGGGAKLYEIAHRLPTTRKAESAYHFVAITTSPTSVKLVARRVDGSLLDQCGFEKGKPWDCDAPPPASPASSPGSGHDSPDAPSTSSSRCGCSLPGAASVPALAGLFAAAGLGLAALRRRRG